MRGETTQVDVEHQATVLDRLRDEARAQFTARGARAVAIPREFSLRATYAGQPLEIEIEAFQGGPYSWVRLVRLDAGSKAQALNLVALPSAHHLAPCVAAEILSFSRGVHLVVADAWSTNQWRGPVHRSLAQSRSWLSRRWPLEAVPDWGKEVFSEDAIILRPGAQRGAKVSAFAPVVRAAIKSLNNTAWRAPQQTRAHLRARARWLRAQAEHEPAHDFLARLGGQAWVERLTDQVLYPDWLLDGDRAAPFG